MTTNSAVKMFEMSSILYTILVVIINELIASRYLFFEFENAVPLVWRQHQNLLITQTQHLHDQSSLQLDREGGQGRGRE